MALPSLMRSPSSFCWAGGIQGFCCTGDLTSASFQCFTQAVELFAQPDVGVRLQAESKKYAQQVQDKKISAQLCCM